MEKRDNLPAPRPARDPPRGILRAAALQEVAEHRRFDADPPLDALVEHFWRVSWDLGDRPPMTQEIVPHPAVVLTFEGGRGVVTGVCRSLFLRELEGRGQVFGIKLRPGVAGATLGRSARSLTGRVLPVEALLGDEGRRLTEAMSRARGDAEAIAAATPWLLERLAAAQADPQVQLARAAAARILADRDLTRVDALAAALGVTPRTLQRAFSSQIGVSPKWVIRRYRMHEALHQASQGDEIDWASLALDLGYFDQAHFVRDFKATVGVPPTAVRRGGG